MKLFPIVYLAKFRYPNLAANILGIVWRPAFAVQRCNNVVPIVIRPAELIAVAIPSWKYTPVCEASENEVKTCDYHET